MTKLVLQISEEDMPDRIAIYSTLEGYRLMYLMNKELSSYFVRLTNRKDLLAYQSLVDESSFFEVYQWRDEIRHCYWVCIKNKMISQIKGNEKSLFHMTSSVDYWDKNYAKADFILEVAGSDYSLTDIENICLQIEKLPDVLSTQII